MNINCKEPQTNMPKNMDLKKSWSAKIYQVNTKNSAMLFELREN